MDRQDTFALSLAKFCNKNRSLPEVAEIQRRVMRDIERATRLSLDNGLIQLVLDCGRDIPLYEFQDKLRLEGLPFMNPADPQKPLFIESRIKTHGQQTARIGYLIKPTNESDGFKLTIVDETLEPNFVTRRYQHPVTREITEEKVVDGAKASFSLKGPEITVSSQTGINADSLEHETFMGKRNSPREQLEANAQLAAFGHYITKLFVILNYCADRSPPGPQNGANNNHGKKKKDKKKDRANGLNNYYSAPILFDPEKVRQLKEASKNPNHVRKVLGLVSDEQLAKMSLPQVIQYHYDNAATKEERQELQPYVDALRKVPHVEFDRKAHDLAVENEKHMVIEEVIEKLAERGTPLPSCVIYGPTPLPNEAHFQRSDDPARLRIGAFVEAVEGGFKFTHLREVVNPDLIKREKKAGRIFHHPRKIALWLSSEETVVSSLTQVMTDSDKIMKGYLELLRDVPNPENYTQEYIESCVAKHESHTGMIAGLIARLFYIVGSPKTFIRKLADAKREVVKRRDADGAQPFSHKTPANRPVRVNLTPGSSTGHSKLPVNELWEEEKHIARSKFRGSDGLVDAAKVHEMLDPVVQEIFGQDCRLRIGYVRKSRPVTERQGRPIKSYEREAYNRFDVVTGLTEEEKAFPSVRVYKFTASDDKAMVSENVPLYVYRDEVMREQVQGRKEAPAATTPKAQAG